jgi:hypothetical protein
MRGRVIVAIAFLCATVAAPAPAEAQFSSIIGAVTSPIRHLFGHFPRFHRHQAAPTVQEPHAAANSSAGTLAPAAQTSGEARLANLGPAAWPSAYEDLIGYAFWPDSYARKIKSRGFALIADTINGPAGPAMASARRVSTTGSAPSEGCAAAAANDNWPRAKIEQSTQLSVAQEQTLQKFQSALDQSTKSKCPMTNAGGVLPSDRLGALVQVLWAVRDTGQFVREPLAAFAASLSDAQRNAIAGPPHEISTKSATGPSNEDIQACAAQNVGDVERMMKQLEQRVRPTNDQAAGLERLHKTSIEMAKLLAASCARPTPSDAVARLDAVDDQLTTLNYAATTLQIAFDDFYAKRDEQQKARQEPATR